MFLLINEGVQKKDVEEWILFSLEMRLNFLVD